MNYKLIVTDMDGTLLNGEHEISRKNKEALKFAADKGVNVAIATGRIYESTIKYARELGIKTPIICCNGALIKESNGNIIYESQIENYICNNIIDVLEKNNIYYQCFTDDTIFTTYINEWLRKYQMQEDLNIKIIETENIKEQILGKNILKFLIIESNLELLSKVECELKTIEDIELTKSFFDNIEIMKKGVNKGSAVESLGKYLDIDKSEIITFGDNHNDLSMIKYAGMGVAMGNAEDIVKKNANFITCKNTEDGVAKALSEILK
ncbi:Cof-type HAD-IIB family hydrolase [Paraclostridium sp. AKS73]|uniref:Cof-type HAD-IIB family hydrolase n=1 Tax=Paraclostridium sp. AKS73 TaxID=2876116 RepID=UPI0021DFFBBF|nr:Cof-type HAD-IIB family hydrolase [Paraclostridium sp. AKS73]MCU9814677.1 Cof-type HAD-IIB family hydrolase [Paraclostridium sp. AKS73]